MKNFRKVLSKEGYNLRKVLSKEGYFIKRRV
ncbi:hypothetical protein ANME2D_00246 [Candidatus Methanoperedens nitroreducens]|uniref:Uncharacterized protein n=1 Tax=Candidatus Methanoperedens nitratireducens TaxID=1392998 RepID=A0A062V248_9EURY|nr:hypothetical protein ANME2D_00246 [Candidatus Methanoperedens nitroreducens]